MDLAAEPAATRAYRALEQMIVTLELPPASMTTESALIERLALGRTPVREAIQRLGWEGLVEIRPRSGLAIAPLKAGDWPLVIEARRGVEIVLAQSAARHASPDAAKQLEEAASAMKQAAVDGDVHGFLEADKRLDEVIAAAADNVYAARVAAPLQTHSRRFWFRFQGGHGPRQSAERHLALIAAILDGDEAAAAREAATLMDMLHQLAVQASRR